MCHDARRGNHLGVDDDGASLLDVGAAVDEHVADAVRMAEHRDLRVPLDVRHLSWTDERIGPRRLFSVKVKVIGSPANGNTPPA